LNPECKRIRFRREAARISLHATATATCGSEQPRINPIHNNNTNKKTGVAADKSAMCAAIPKARLPKPERHCGERALFAYGGGGPRSDNDAMPSWHIQASFQCQA